MFKLNNFREGIVEMAKIIEDEQEILSIYMDDKNINEIISLCENYFHKDRYLWVQAFYYIINLDNIDLYFNQFQTILQKLYKFNILSPMLVLKALRKKKNIKLQLYKQYIVCSLEQVNNELKQEKQAFDSCYANIRSLNKDLIELKSKPITFNIINCSICNENFVCNTINELSNIPLSKIIIFYCKHAFHSNCLNNNYYNNLDNNNRESMYNEDESSVVSNYNKNCPICINKLEQVNKRLYNKKDNNIDHNSFFRQLQNKNNKFDYIAKSIGKGLIKTDL